MANKDIFGLKKKGARELAKKAAETAAKEASTGKAGEIPEGASLHAVRQRRRMSNPSLRGDMFGVTVPDGPKEDVELTPSSPDEAFGTPKKKKEEE